MAYSTIDKPSKYFNEIIYTGDGASPRSLTGVGFQPDLVYIRNRDQAGSWAWYDAVRGTGASKNLSTDSSNAEGSGGDATGYGYLSAFNTDGFSVTTGSVAYNIVNQSGIKYAAWNWLGANTTVSNTSGSITSTVSANTTSGFSIVTFTYSSGSPTVGHGLGVAPSMVIVKNRTSTANNWLTYHKSMGATQAMYLNGTNAATTSSLFWNNTAPTSSVFTVSTNLYAADHVAYCFAEVKGFSKAFSYTGNGNNNGTFCYLGFKPSFILWKDKSNIMNWGIFDNKRDTFNEVENFVKPNTNEAEAFGDYQIDFLSNGFKIRNANGYSNNSGDVYVGMAFAENPFVSSKGIPTTAR